VRDLLQQAPGEVVRLALMSAHYRQPLDWSADVLVEARRKLDRLYNALRNVSGWQDDWQNTPPSAEFTEALEDDLNTPRAIAALFNLARDLNRLGNAAEAPAVAKQLRASAAILGLLGQDPAEWCRVGGSAEDDSAAEIDALLLERNAARKARDFAAADRIRDQLLAMSVIIEDGPAGSSWRRVDDKGGN